MQVSAAIAIAAATARQFRFSNSLGEFTNSINRKTIPALSPSKPHEAKKLKIQIQILFKKNILFSRAYLKSDIFIVRVNRDPSTGDMALTR